MSLTIHKEADRVPYWHDRVSKALENDLEHRFAAHGVTPAQFRLLVSPLVAWIWIGGLIVFAGGLIALWPAPDAARSRARAGYAARVAQDLDRA